MEASQAVQIQLNSCDLNEFETDGLVCERLGTCNSTSPFYARGR